MKTGDIIILLGAAGLAVWLKNKYSGSSQGAPGVPSGQTKTPISESPSIPLDVWQGLTGQQLSTLPVTEATGVIGGSTYYKTAQPIAIGNTGFKIWGMDQDGAVVIALNDPATYNPMDWLPY